MKKIIALCLALMISPASADVMFGTNPPTASCIIAIGLKALENCTECAHTIVIGTNSGKTITNEHHIIIVGGDIDIPKPGTSYYVNILGKEYKWSEVASVRSLLFDALSERCSDSE